MKKIFCCVSAIILPPILICCLAFGGITYAFNRFVQPVVGMSLGETFSLVSKLGKSKEAEIVTKPIDLDGTEVDGFMNNVKKTLFVSDSCNLTFNDILQSIAPPKPTTPVVEVPNRDLSSAETGGTGATPSNPPTETVTPQPTAPNKFDAILEKIDFDMKDIYNNVASPVSVTDDQVAGVVTEIIKYVSANVEIGALQGLPIKIDELISLKQLTVEAEVLNDINTKFSLILTVNIRENVKKVLEAKSVPMAGAIAGILPKQIFLTGETYPMNNEKPTKITINSFTDEDMTNLFTMIDNILAYTNKGATAQSGSDILVAEGGVVDVASTQAKTISSILLSVNKKVVDTFQKINGYMDLNFTDSGFTSDPLESLIKLGKLNGKNAVTKAELQSMIKDVGLVQVANGESNTKYMLNYSPQDGDEMFTNFLNAYAINNPTTDPFTKDNFKDRINKIPLHVNFRDKGTFTTLKDKYDAINKGFLLEEKHLAYLIGSNFKDMDYKIQNIEVTQTTQGFELKLMAAVDVKGLLNLKKDSASVTNKLVDRLLNAILPSNTKAGQSGLINNADNGCIFLEIGADFTKKGDNSQVAIGRIIINGSQNTDQTLATLTTMLKAMGTDTSKFNIEGIKKTVSEQLQKAISGLEEKGTGKAIEYDKNGGKDGIKIASLFDIVLSKVYTKVPVVTAPIAGEIDYDAKLAAYNKYLADVVEYDNRPTALSVSDTMYSLNNMPNPQTIYNGLADGQLKFDTSEGGESSEGGKFSITDRCFADLIKNKTDVAQDITLKYMQAIFLKGGSVTERTTKIKNSYGITSTGDTIVLSVDINIAKLIAGGLNNDTSIMLMNMVPVDIMITLSLDVTKMTDPTYAPTINIDGVSDANIATIEKLINHFNRGKVDSAGKPKEPLNIKQLCMNIKEIVMNTVVIKAQQITISSSIPGVPAQIVNMPSYTLRDVLTLNNVITYKVEEFAEADVMTKGIGKIDFTVKPPIMPPTKP
ncbi:MAG: hypothetical protein RRY78_02965 [Clostridia bacterium]